MRNLFVLGLLILALFALVVGCDREVNYISEDGGDGYGDYTNNEECMTCHNGLLLQAKGEWQNSIHASGNTIDYTNRGGSDCTQCHSHQGFLDYLATGEVNAPYDNVSAIHCFTCHAPHERGDLSLRTMEPVTLANGVVFDHNEGNLCANCHRSRVDVGTLVDGFTVTSTHWGPHHGPQGDLLAATGGYEFAGYNYGNSAHAVAAAKACATCHMGNPTQHDGYGVGGHSFNIQDEEGNSISGVCSSCHNDANKIDFDADADYDHDGEIEGYQTEMVGLADSLAVLLYNAGALSAVEDGHPVTGTYADGDLVGALYNYIYFEEDRSEGIHNFRYMQGLLQSSIDYLNSATVSGNGNTPTIAKAH